MEIRACPSRRSSLYARDVQTNTTNPMNSNARTIIGKIRNIHPSNPEPTWEVCFDPALHADDFPSTHESWVELEWPSGTYRSMVGIKAGNWIYLRTAAVSVDGSRETRVSDLCRLHGLGRSGPIKVEVLENKRRYRVRIEE